MKYITSTIFILISSSAIANSNHPLDNYLLDGKQIHWQNQRSPNRYYLDLDQNGKAERMDVLLSNGLDRYSQLNLKKGYQSKERIRYEGKKITYEYQKRLGKSWKTYKSKEITKLNVNEIDYEVWFGDNQKKNGFKERLDSSSLLSEEIMCRHEKPKESLSFSGMQQVLSSFPSIFKFMPSCFNFCSELIKKFKLNIEDSPNGCKFLFESMASKSLTNTLSCLIKNKELKSVGPDIAHQILGGLRHDGANSGSEQKSIDVQCVKNKKFLAKTFGLLFEPKREVTIDIGDFIKLDSVGLESQFNAAFGHELYHLGGYFHTQNEVDVSYSCNECCNSGDALACNICSQSDKQQMEGIDYLLAALMYDKYVDPEKGFRVYHKAIEKLHEVIQDESFFTDFDKKIPISRESIIDKLYHQLVTHIRNPVDNRGENKLRYSDMLAEIMAKINCSDVGRLPSDERSSQDRYGCEVMYLARSIPSSYCYQRRSKQSCVEAIRLRYVRRKRVDRTGIPIPNNFLTLDQVHD